MDENAGRDRVDLGLRHPQPGSGAREPQFDALRSENGRVPAAAADEARVLGGAKYKSMTPARLPIARSPCLTVPPGLSPSTLLDSPVLLSNVKVEPSPTTGTFLNPMIRHATFDSVGYDAFSSPRDSSDGSAGSLCDFEFKPHMGSSPRPGLSSLGSMVSCDLKRQQCKTFSEFQNQCQPQAFPNSPSAKSESLATLSNELSLSVVLPNASVHMINSMISEPTRGAPDELQQSPDDRNHTLEPDNQEPSTLVVIDRSAEDGYNWRKYGQKLVKGSEFPRSYYKCTHPNCHVKKQFERSYDGHITDIMYKGSHDHPKPQPSRRLAVGAYLPGQAQEHSDDFSALHSVGDTDNLPNAHGHSSHLTETNSTTQLSPVSVSDDETEGAGTRFNKVGDEPVDDDEDPEAKRRKKEMGSTEIFNVAGKVNREPRVVVQTISEVDILDDGYRWRKYGQKVVKGNPNPRSYYKCTSDGCPVRKHVERAGHDPKAVITTYEGKHNHDVPAARNSSHDAAPPAVSRSHDSSRITHNPYERPEHTNTISLDLGVGISPSIPKQEATDTEQVYKQVLGRIHISNSHCKVIQGTPVSAYYNSLNNRSNDRTGDLAPPLSHGPAPYRDSMGRSLLTGP